MITTIKFQDKICRCLNEKSSLNGLDILTIYKAIGLQLHKMWFLSDKILEKITWISFCQEIENEYKKKNTIIKDDYSFSMCIENDEKIEMIIEISNIKDPIINSINEAAQQLALYLLENSWDNYIYEMLPYSQKEIREKMNNTFVDISEHCMTAKFLENALVYNDKPALVWYENDNRCEMSYEQLKSNALKTADMLIKNGIQEGALVSIILPKGIEQIIAVLGVMLSGATYVPVGVSQPLERKKKIISSGKINYVLTNIKEDENLKTIENIRIIHIEDLQKFHEYEKPIVPSLHSAAYIIFTSGTTGLPKGVVISHKAANNTIQDIIKRFSINNNDIGIAISELDFDLSVFDIFGLLSAGGTLVILNEENKKEPEIWKRILIENNVSIWNSVPAFFDMLITTCETNNTKIPLKRVMLSGDWINMNMFERMKALTDDCDFISLGGATEASIWSNYYKVKEIEDDWTSIPYGQPLGNQQLRVINKRGYDCPDYVIGELYIGGKGVANEYLNDTKLTSDKFIKDSKGVAWYKTGDMARYKSDGIIEFLGRMDNQVKLNGFRIEIGEIENNIKKYSEVDEIVAGIIEANNSKCLTALIVPKMINKTSNEVVISKDDTNYSEAELKNRFEDVKSILVVLYKKYKNVIDKENNYIKNILRLWEEWIIKNEINYDEEMNFKADCNSLVNRQFKTDFGRVLFKHINLFSEILEQKKVPEELLKIKELSPENLSMAGEDTQYFLDGIFDEIKTSSDESDEVIRIAILGARTGVAAETIINNMEEYNVEMGLFDNSYGMLDMANERFADCDKKIEYIFMENGFFDQSKLYSYDFVISINTLHSYEDPKYGLNISRLILKSSGKLLAIEYKEFDPMALMISIILENGFSSKLIGRSRINSPLLTSEEWKKYLIDSGYEKINIVERGKLGAEFIKAQLDNQYNIIEDSNFNNYVKSSLPSYMVPDKFIIIPWIILNKNGKVDRKSMLETAHKFLPKSYVESDIFEEREKEIAELWKELLLCDSISRNQNFFEIGGDSLSATRFLSKVKEKYGVEIAMKELFETPKLCEVSQLIDEKIDEIGEMIEGEL